MKYEHAVKHILCIALLCLPLPPPNPRYHSYSVVIEGERGNRPRIYSLEQLLQEAVNFKLCFSHKNLTHVPELMHTHITDQHTHRPTCLLK